jgi:V/A-type H+-transporting ATPase subunit C
MLSNIILKDNNNFAYASAVIKSKEKALLEDGDFIELLDENLSDFLSILVEKGYRMHDDKVGITFEKIYDWEQWHLFHLIDELLEISDILEIKPLFHLSNECLNCKLLAKAVFLSDKKEEIISSEKIDFLNLSAYGLRKQSELFQFFKALAVHPEQIENYANDKFLYQLGKSILNLELQKYSPSTFDILIDKYYYDNLFKYAKAFKSDFLFNLYDMLTGLLNLKNSIRIFSEKKDYLDFEDIALQSNFIGKEVCEELFELKFTNIASLFVNNPLYNEIQQMISTFDNEKNLSLIEKAIDDCITSELSEGLRSAFFNIENIVGYQWAKEIELKNLKIIYIGKVNNLPRENIAKLLRISYV